MVESLSLNAALSAARTAIDAAATEAATGAQNIANAATPGYARERGDLQELPAFSGVAVAQIERIVSSVTRNALVAATGDLAGATAQSQLLTQVQALFGEPADGLSALLTGFWNAWQQVADTPSDPGVRQALVAQAQQVTAKFQAIAQGIQALRVSTVSAVVQQVGQVDALAQQVAALNLKIQAGQAAGQDTNALADQRDQVIQQLAQLAGVQAAQPVTGEPTLVIGGQPLVVGGQVYALAATASGASVSVTWQEDGAPAPISGGQLGAELTVLTQTLPQIGSQLDAVASALISAVNTQHARGYTLDQPPATGIAFFTGTTAAKIAVASQVAQDVNEIAASASGAPNDGANAQAIAALATAPVAGGGVETVDAEYNAAVVALAAQLQAAQQGAQASQSQVTQFQQLDQCVSGVSLSEEQTNLLLDQQQSQAASSVLNAVQTMLQSLLAAVAGA